MIDYFISTPAEMGAFFREQRKLRKEAQYEVAEAIGYPRYLVTTIESGVNRNPGLKKGAREEQPKNNVWQALCRHYDLSYEALLQNSYLQYGWYHPRKLQAARPTQEIADLSVEEVFRALIAAGKYCETRIAPSKCNLRKFALAKGYESLDRCPISVFDLTVNEIRDFIDQQEAASMGNDAYRNYKFDVRDFVKKAKQSSFLEEKVNELISDYQLHEWKRQGNERLRVKPYSLTPKEIERATVLSKECLDYSEYFTHAKRSEKKRLITRKAHIATFKRFGGYLVRYQGFSFEDLSLRSMITKDLVDEYVHWHLEKAKQKYAGALDCGDEEFSGVTDFINIELKHLQTAASQYLHDKAVADQLKEIQDDLDWTMAVRDKEALLVPLEQLELAGESIFPYNPLRMNELNYVSLVSVRRVLDHIMKYKDFPQPECKIDQHNERTQKPRPIRNGRLYAFRVMMSLIFRILVRIPLRQRNLREMRIGKNIFRDGDKYVVHFKGAELKVAFKKKKLNVLKFVIAKAGDGFFEAIEQWLSIWRPCVMKEHLRYLNTTEGKAKLKKSERYRNVLYASQDICHPDSLLPDHDFFFVDMNGNQLTVVRLSTVFKRYARRYLGIPLTPHLIRDCWATHYLRSTKEKNGAADIERAALMLGNSPSTVMKHYAHLIDEHSQEIPQQWILELLKKARDKRKTEPETKMKLKVE